MKILAIDRLLTVIVNHNCNASAIELKRRFSLICDTVLLDSGSDLTDEEAAWFDWKLPNVYYNGLLNKTSELAAAGHYSHVLFITSDVEIGDAGSLLNRIRDVYAKFPVSVYAPSARHSVHRHMNNQGRGDLSAVTFVEGFCFAVPVIYLDKICPIDLSVNKLGHGVDIYLGFLGMMDKRYAMVDDTITVDHPFGSGYSEYEARVQRDAWFETKCKKARVFHRMVSNDWLKNRPGFHLVNFIMRII